MFRVPTRVIIGPGCRNQLPELLISLGAKKSLVISDGGVAAAPWFASFLEVCGAHELDLAIEPNPRHSTIDSLANRAREGRFDCVIGIGGGSVLDAAKAVSMLLSNPGSIRDYEGKNKFPHPALPFIALPTTCGTGSEVTWVSVISVHHEGRKISVKGDLMFPRFALVDAELLASLPAHLVASTGMDAMTHAIEAVVGKPSNPTSDALALEAIRLLQCYLPAAANQRAAMGHIVSKEDRKMALEKVMLASTLAGMAFGNADVGAVHCLSESIGGVHDLPHGLLNTLLLVPVLRYQQNAIADPLQMVANALQVKDGDLFGALETLIAGLPLQQWSELNIPTSTFAEIAQKSETNGSNGSNLFDMKASDYLAILEAM